MSNDKKCIGYCGIDCSRCGPYQAWAEDSDEKRAAVAQCWSQALAQDIKPEDVNCTSCRSDSEPLFGYCASCSVRICARDHKVHTCAHCPEYPCDLLEVFFKTMPYARDALEKVKDQLSNES